MCEILGRPGGFFAAGNPHFIPKTLVVGHVDNHLKRSQISRTPSQNGHLHNCQDIRSFWLLLGNVPGIVLKFSLEDINSG